MINREIKPRKSTVSCAPWGQKFPLVVLVAALTFMMGGGIAHALFIEPSPSDTIVFTSGNCGASSPLSLGFSFPYFGATQTQVSMDIDGSLLLGTVGGFPCDNQGFPIIEGFGRVAPFWDDLLVSPGNVRKNALTPGQFVAIWNAVGVTGKSGRLIAEVVLLGPGNPFGAPSGTIVFSYDGIEAVNSPVTVGLNKGNGINFATLASLLGTATNGTLTETQAKTLLPGTTYTFTPTGSSTYSVIKGGPGGTPTLTLTLTGCTTCKADDTFSVNATVKNPGTKPVPVEIKAGVVLPDGTEVNIWVIPDKHFTVDLQPGLDLTMEILNVRVPGGLPKGTWAYEAALAGPELGRTLARDAKTFTMQ